MADIAEQLGRSPDGLYYHVRALVGAGLLEQYGVRAGVRQSEAVYGIRPRGGSLRLHYDPDDAENGAAVGGVVSSMLRVAERDFRNGFMPGLAQCDGPERNLRAARRKGWLSTEDLREVNGLLERLWELLHQGRAPGRDRLFALTHVLAPVRPSTRRRGRGPQNGERPRAADRRCR